MFLIMDTHSGLKRFESEQSKAFNTGKNQVSSHLTSVLQPTHRAKRRMTSWETSLTHSLVTIREPYAYALAFSRFWKTGQLVPRQPMFSDSRRCLAALNKPIKVIIEWQTPFSEKGVATNQKTPNLY